MEKKTCPKYVKSCIYCSSLYMCTEPRDLEEKIWRRQRLGLGTVTK